MLIWQSTLAVLIGYLLGSFPAAYIIGRFRKGIDIRTVGSRNMGTLNTFREVGLLEAVAVLILDVGKGIAAIFIARTLGVNQIVVLASGAAAMAGHVFPVFLSFHGGKGGATAMGILLILMPWATPFYLLFTLIGYFLMRNTFFAYGIAFFVFPVVAWLVYHSLPFITFSLLIILGLTIQNLNIIQSLRHKGFRHTILRSNSKNAR